MVRVLVIQSKLMVQYNFQIELDATIKILEGTIQITDVAMFL